MNIIGVYLEQATSTEAAIKTQKVLTDKVQRCVDNRENCVIMGDMNAASNPNVKTKTAARKQMLAWEETGKIITLNDKYLPTRVPYQAGRQANCIDLGIVTP